MCRRNLEEFLPLANQELKTLPVLSLHILRSFIYKLTFHNDHLTYYRYIIIIIILPLILYLLTAIPPPPSPPHLCILQIPE